jgi:ATP-binding cassette subfamily B protein
VNEISSQYNSLQSSLAGAERIFQIMDEIPEMADIADAVTLEKIKGDVQFNNVTFGYDRDKVVLKNISFSAAAGQKIALVGSTGAGKTTIMNLLPRFYDIQSGQITIDGHDIQKIKRISLRRSLAIVLQDTHLFTATVMENIRYGKLDASDEEVINAAVLAGADSFIRRMPKGYQTVLENDGGNLSQGQRQLLNISRAAVAKPAILILDEATSSIDTRTEVIIQKGMDALMQGRTSFVIAHRLSTVRNATEIMVLENGEIIERGNHETLLKQKGRYHELFIGQFD